MLAVGRVVRPQTYADVWVDSSRMQLAAAVAAALRGHLVAVQSAAAGPQASQGPRVACPKPLFCEAQLCRLGARCGLCRPGSSTDPLAQTGSLRAWILDPQYKLARQRVRSKSCAALCRYVKIEDFYCNPLPFCRQRQEAQIGPSIKSIV